MKLLYFASDFTIGLSALLTDELTAIFRANIPLVAIAGDKEQEPGLLARVNARNIDLRIIRTLDDHSNFKRKVHEIAQIIKSEGIDVVHVQNNWQLALVSYCKYILRCKIKIIYTLHGFRHNSPVKSIIAQIVIGSALLLFADRVRCMCSYLKNKFHIINYKIEVLPLGVSDGFFEIKSLIPTESIKAVFPAQFRHGKNHDTLINAFAEYVKQTGDRVSTLTLPGSGPLIDEMKQLAQKSGIKNQINFPGQMSKKDIISLYTQSNIGLVSSNSETFGQSIVEPFVLGLCVITRKVGIALDIIDNGQNGFFFDNQKDLTEIFIKLSSNKDIIKTCGERAKVSGVQFKWSVIAEQYCKMLSNL